MKKYLFISILFLSPYLVFAQNKSIDGFMDIPFGSDSATVKAAMIAKGAVQNDSLSGKDVLAFTGFSMSDRKVNRLYVSFVNNKAYEAYFIFNEFPGNDPLNFYDSFSTDIKAVYGKGSVVSDNFDGANSFKIKKLESGNASCQTAWKSKNKNIILLGFDSNHHSILVYLDYTNTALKDLSKAKIRSDL